MFHKFYRAPSKYQPVQAYLKNLLAIEILYFSHIYFYNTLKIHYDKSHYGDGYWQRTIYNFTDFGHFGYVAVKSRLKIFEIF